MSRFTNVCFVASALFWCALSLAAVPAPAHQELTAYLNSATDWAQQLRFEIRKGRGKDHESRVKIEEKIAGVRDSLKSVNSTYGLLAEESPGDLKEAHFAALRGHQERAAALIRELELEVKKQNPDYARMTRDSGQVLRELEAARHQHELELAEIERHPEA